MGPMSEVIPQTRALVLFSGGQDSSVCLAWALARHDHVETVGFDYGQRHAVEMEQRSVVREAVRARFPQWAGKLGEDHVLDLTGFGAVGDTAMTEERAFEITERESLPPLRLAPPVRKSMIAHDIPHQLEIAPACGGDVFQLTGHLLGLLGQKALRKFSLDGNHGK